MDWKFHRLLRGLALVGWLAWVPAIACGQEAQSDESEPAAQEPAAQADEKGAVDAKDSPLVAEPKSADELFEATLLMTDIARLDLAKLYLDKLMEQPLGDDVLLALRDKYGAASILRLMRVDELKTSATKLLELSSAAAIKRAADTDRIARLIGELEGDPEQAAFARAELQSLGTAVVPGLLALLNDPQQEERHETAIEAVVALGQPAVPLLLGALETPSPALRTYVMMILGRLRATSAVPFLWYPAISQDESPAVRGAARRALARILDITGAGIDRLATEGTVARLLETAREHFRNEYAWKTDGTGKVTLWSWNARQSALASRVVSPEEASEILGLKFAREALALAPQQRPAQVLYLGLALAGEIRRAGYDKPLPTGPGSAHDLALSVGSDVAIDLLADAASSARPAVAVAALKILSQIGTADELNVAFGRRSNIVTALDYPDPRVQFAAATAILQIDPKAPFRGARRVVEVLTRALSANGRSHAVIGEVSPDRGAMIGGFLKDLGYEPVVYMSGRDAFAAAAARSDVDLVVLHPHIVRWPLSETLANLRADARTANIPIVIHGPGDLMPKMQRHTHNFQLVSFSLASETTADFEFQLTPFLRQIKTPAMTSEERARQRSDAVAWLAHIAEGRRTKIYDISGAESELTEMLDDEKLAAPALEALGEIASRSSQNRIAELVLDPRADLELRKTAALKLAFHIQRFGLLLPQGLIARLHQA